MVNSGQANKSIYFQLKGMNKMRYSSKGEVTSQSANQLFGVDFQDTIQKEPSRTDVEFAQEFNMTHRSIKQMKENIERN